MPKMVDLPISQAFYETLEALGKKEGLTPAEMAEKLTVKHVESFPIVPKEKVKPELVKVEVEIPKQDLEHFRACFGGDQKLKEIMTGDFIKFLHEEQELPNLVRIPFSRYEFNLIKAAIAEGIENLKNNLYEEDVATTIREWINRDVWNMLSVERPRMEEWIDKKINEK